uniref:Uncharacterized protein n=1 Tax=Setaria viridis TaxID=4556 RepID=A0A4U6VB63_SETVI|nr:hypothetical protein SEVIR_3G202250v2 [Setaria viridis]
MRRSTTTRRCCPTNAAAPPLLLAAARQHAPPLSSPCRVAPPPACSGQLRRPNVALLRPHSAAPSPVAALLRPTELLARRRTHAITLRPTAPPSCCRGPTACFSTGVPLPALPGRVRVTFAAVRERPFFIAVCAPSSVEKERPCHFEVIFT